jgi:hypothetical protein
VIELAASLEATGLATALRRSVWLYPLVNAGHILGLALLIGSVVPMDVAILRRGTLGAFDGLRAFALGGFCLAAGCGVLLFAAQATEYLRSPWFLAKVGLILLASLNALLHFASHQAERTQRLTAAASLVLWILALICGRMIGFR